MGNANLAQIGQKHPSTPFDSSSSCFHAAVATAVAVCQVERKQPSLSNPRVVQTHTHTHKHIQRRREEAEPGR